MAVCIGFVVLDRTFFILLIVKKIPFEFVICIVIYLLLLYIVCALDFRSLSVLDFRSLGVLDCSALDVLDCSALDCRILGVVNS